MAKKAKKTSILNRGFFKGLISCFENSNYLKIHDIKSSGNIMIEDEY